MSVRNLLLFAVLLAAVSIRCAGSPSKPGEGTVSITQTTTTTTSVPIGAVSAGSIGTSPPGVQLVSATVVAFLFVTPPSGGVPHYTFAWKFGDGVEGSGNAPSHIYMVTGDFTATATVTDSRGMSAQATTAVAVRSVTGRWNATLQGATSAHPGRLDLIQDGTAVTATSNDATLGLGSGTGSVANPRSLAASLAFTSATPLPFAATYVGRLDDTLTTWTGTVTGFSGCPCAFVATRPP